MPLYVHRSGRITPTKSLALTSEEDRGYSLRGIGITIAKAAHLEGQRAYRQGKKLTDNPYDSKAERDSDEWLRFNNWKCGWTSGYWI